MSPVVSSENTTARAASKRRATPLIALALVAIAAPYLAGLNNGFVWLDHKEIVDGALIVDSPSEIAGLFSDDRSFDGYHRPIYNLVHSFDRAIWRNEAFGFHLSSLLIHLANVALLGRLLLRLGWERPRTLALCLLWGLHPVNTAAVGLIHAKADLVYVFALLSSINLFVGSENSSRSSVVRIASALVCFAMALWTKEVAYCFPVGVAWWYREARKEKALQVPGLPIYVLGLVIVALVFGMLRLTLSVRPQPGHDLGLLERAATFGAVYSEYVRVLLFPKALFVGDTVLRYSALTFASQLRVLLTLALLVAMQVSSWIYLPATRKWILIYNLALLPVAQAAPILHFRADRFLYLPSLAFLGGAIEAIATRLAQVSQPRARVAGRIATLVVVVVAAAYALRDLVRLRVFRNDVALFSTELKTHPGYREGLSHLARRYDIDRNYLAAQQLYERCDAVPASVVSYVSRDVFYLNWSFNLLAQGKADEAYRLISRVENTDFAPEPRIHLMYNKGVAAYRMGRHGEALELLTEYDRRVPDDSSCKYLLGMSARVLGRNDIAHRTLSEYIRLAPRATDRAAVEAILRELAR